MSIIIATCVAYDPDFEVELMRLAVRIHYAIRPEYGDGWNEPREPRHVEYIKTERVDGQPVSPALETWAKLHLDMEADDLLDGAIRSDPDELRDAAMEHDRLEKAWSNAGSLA